LKLIGMVPHLRDDLPVPRCLRTATRRSED